MSAVSSDPRKIDWSVPLRDARSADPALLLERDQVEKRPHHLPAVAEQEEEDEEGHQEGQDGVEEPLHDAAREPREDAVESLRELSRLRQQLGRRDTGLRLHPRERLAHGRDAEDVVQAGDVLGSERGRGAPDHADRLVHEDAHEEARRQNHEEADGEGQEDGSEAPAARHLPLYETPGTGEGDGEDDRPREGRAERRQDLHGERADSERYEREDGDRVDAGRGAVGHDDSSTGNRRG